MIRLQPLVRARLATSGQVGTAWREALPDVLADLCRSWGLRLGRGLPGGSASYVVEATDRDGRPRVLKVGLPGEAPALAREAAVLSAAAGRGYAVLHGRDPARDALLLERLGGSLERAMPPPHAVLDTLAGTLAEAWQVEPPESVGAGGPSRATALAELVERLADRHPAACTDDVLGHALGLAADLAATDDPSGWVLCHGDPHPGNLLRREVDGGWAFVDPDGLRADPAYDAGIGLRDWTSRLLRSDDPRTLVAEYADRLASRTGLDADRVEAWGYLERVSTGLYVLDLGATALARRFLDSAALLLHSPGRVVP